MPRENDLKNALDSRHGWKFGGKSPDLENLLFGAGKPSDALLYSILFMPELTMFSDSVFLSSKICSEDRQQEFLSALAKGIKSRQEIESNFNWEEIGHLFDDEGYDTSDKEDELLANLVRDAWKGWLLVSYPNREFTVEIISPGKTGGTVGVGFYEVR
jgi:hypothetical protein